MAGELAAVSRIQGHVDTVASRNEWTDWFGLQCIAGDLEAPESQEEGSRSGVCRPTGNGTRCLVSDGKAAGEVNSGWNRSLKSGRGRSEALSVMAGQRRR